MTSKAKGKGQCGGERAPRPQMHIHQPHFAQVVSVSANGRSATSHTHPLNVTHKAPDYVHEDILTNAAVESWDHGYDLGDPALVAEVQEDVDDGILLKSKRKVYENSDYPMLMWADHQNEYLDEMLRLKGRGYPAIYFKCGGCSEADPTFRCAQQTCYGPGLFCKKCIVACHAVLPTHWIQEWNGNFFEQRAPKDLGLVIQLGHPPGFSCDSPLRAHKNFVVIDVTGIHYVEVNFCHCDGNIEHRQQLMRGKISAHDFLRSLELLTNSDGLNHLPDCRRAFRHIVRQYRMKLMLKRTGRGHNPSGVQGTAQGELTLPCRACPHTGRNLPDGWDRINWAEMPEDLRYKYFLFLGADCNFRLINRNVSSAAKDPILGDGFSYFVNHEKYVEFLCGHVSEEEISSCSGFQAMFLANRKCVKGLCTTGVGGVTCARHNMWRLNGIGDLQLGERYCNMEFILLSSVLNMIIFYLILSYNIACQYGNYFWPRMEKMPDTMQLVLERARLWFKVPNFHLPPHKPSCHSPFSFHYMWGAGQTHGETVEQNWEFTNGAAASTKMMGIGSHHVTLEDLFGFHNWWRQVAWRGIFAKRMAENMKEGQLHRDAFKAFDAALRESAPEMVERWKKWVENWESRQHIDGTESPFELNEKAKEELLKSGEGDEVEQEDMPSTYILMGLEIEESQRYLAIDVKAVANPMDAQTVNFLKRHTNLLKRIRAFCKLQRTYMPRLRKYLTALQHALFDSEMDRNVEAVRLFMPSDILDSNKRVSACAVGLPDIEADLRVGEAREALGGSAAGFAHADDDKPGVLCQINLKIQKANLRYQYARNAVKRLRGDGPWEVELKILEDNDMHALNERVLTAEEAEQRKVIHDYEEVAEEGGVAAFGVLALGESRCTLSWIWYQAKAKDPTEAELVEALRVEWCKASARMRRWHEDVVLVEEEMHRTIESGVPGLWNPRLQEGLTAYAREQQWRETETCDKLQQRVEIVVVDLDDEDYQGGEGDEEEEEGTPDYEDEGDNEVIEVDIMVCLDTCFTRKKKKSLRDPQRTHPDTHFVPEHTAAQTEDYVDCTCDTKEKKKNKDKRLKRATVQEVEEEEDGYKFERLPLPRSVIDGCEASFKAADEKQEKASTEFFEDTVLMSLVSARLCPLGRQYAFSRQEAHSCFKWGFLDRYIGRVAFTVSVFHAFGHKWACQLLYNPRNTSLHICGSADIITACIHSTCKSSTPTKQAVSSWANGLRDVITTVASSAQRRPMSCANVASQNKKRGQQAINSIVLLRGTVKTQRAQTLALMEKFVKAVEADDPNCGLYQAEWEVAEKVLEKAEATLRCKEELGVSENDELEWLSKSEYMCNVMNARALKLRLHECLRARNFEFDPVERTCQRLATAPRSYESAIKQREPTITKITAEYNKLCAKITTLIKTGQAPRGTIAPLPIPLKGLWQLDVDDAIFQDVRARIKAVLELDRCDEEDARLRRENLALCVWFWEEWDVAVRAIDEAGKSILHQDKLVRLCMTWDKCLPDFGAEMGALPPWGLLSSQLSKCCVDVHSAARGVDRHYGEDSAWLDEEEESEESRGKDEDFGIVEAVERADLYRNNANDD
ncbi:CxC2 domain-containing protein [Mycena venus]|uniref:CxC2 domain-containing protein n=1 Tax=Mycena venus TaxID=2733690 RepID=A0A8H6XP17_9AGAR|nr:CxC2 domain-containing protein [Mycena venus]